MKKNIVSASLVVLALVLWMGSGYLASEEPETKQFVEGPSLSPDSNVALTTESSVRVAVIASETRTRHIVLNGKTESKRMVDVKAEISGAVVSRPVERGMRVEQGELLCEIAIDDRKVALEEARASLQTAQIEHQGSIKLKNQGLLSDVAVATSQARREAAQANVYRQELTLARTRIVAPFSGLVENLHMNIGDYATPGASCVTLIDLNPMLVTAQVTEAEVENLIPGQVVSGIASTGRSIEGAVSFVGKQSDPTTRTYPVEITVDNQDYSIRSGLTVSLRIGVEQVPAHRISPSLLTLNDAGAVGLRIVDDNKRVAFKPVEIIEDSAEGMWITGLPGTVNLITVGQEYVSVGEFVEPVITNRGEDQLATL